jgi:hypothetical protein
MLIPPIEKFKNKRFTRPPTPKRLKRMCREGGCIFSQVDRKI